MGQLGMALLPLIASCLSPSQELYHPCATCTHTQAYTHRLSFTLPMWTPEVPQPQAEFLVVGLAVQAGSVTQLCEKAMSKPILL